MYVLLSLLFSAGHLCQESSTLARTSRPCIARSSTCPRQEQNNLSRSLCRTLQTDSYARCRPSRGTGNSRLTVVQAAVQTPTNRTSRTAHGV